MEKEDIKEHNKKDIVKEMFNFFKDIIIIIIIVLVIRKFIVLPFQISWSSMNYNYYDKSFIIVDRLSYLEIPFIWQFKTPWRWDVVVFNTHINWREYFIKRIIWLPWETLKIQSWSVYIKEIWQEDFIQLDEQYLSTENYNSTFVRWNDEENIYEIPEDSYFVMWDNRNASTDSRACFSSCEFFDKSNFLDKSDIIWRIFLDLGYFNFKKFKFINQEWIETYPRFFKSPSKYNYSIIEEWI